MTEGIVIAIITGGMAIVSNILVAWASNSKTIYRIDQLEKKVSEHNNVIGQIAVMKRDQETQWERVDELKEKVERLDDKIDNM